MPDVDVDIAVNLILLGISGWSILILLGVAVFAILKHEDIQDTD